MRMAVYDEIGTWPARELYIMKGQSVGCSWASLDPVRPVEICGACGGLHRHYNPTLCSSCDTAIFEVMIQQRSERMLRAFREAAGAARTFGVLVGAGMRSLPLFLFPNEPEARRFAVAHIGPIDHIWEPRPADPIADIQRAMARMQESYRRPTWGNFDLSQFFPEESDPVAARKARMKQRGPKPDRKQWWRR